MTATPTTALEVLDALEQAGIHLWEDEGRLRYRGPQGALTDTLRDRIRTHRDEVLDLVRHRSGLPTVAFDEQARFDPFPLTDVQQAYLLGRNEAFELGGVACHIYLEVDYPGIAPDRLVAAWDVLIARHDMLRVVIDPAGTQQVLRDVPGLRPEITDLRGAAASDVDTCLARVRTELGHRVHDTTTWPVFALWLLRFDDRTTVALSIDFLVADWASVNLLLDQVDVLLDEPTPTEPAPFEIGFRDFVLAHEAMLDSERYRRDRDYWWERLDTLPPAPDLPRAPGGEIRPRFHRHRVHLPEPAWRRFEQRAREHGVTSTTAVLTAYASVVQRWSRTSRFTLNLTVLNRPQVHPQVNDVVGDFTTTSLLEVDFTGPASVADRAAALGEQVYADLDHGLCSGVEVLREIARRRGRDAAMMPVVFTSAIGLGMASSPGVVRRLEGFGISQTPQVFIDCQATDSPDGLLINWDVREGVLPAGVVDDMVAAFDALLHRMADDASWSAIAEIPLPAWQVAQRRRANDTARPLDLVPLHHGVLAQAALRPDEPAVVDVHGRLTYDEVVRRAGAVADELREAGCGPGDRVAVMLEKSAEQVVAALGVLLCGAAYVPVGAAHPPARRDRILRAADVRHVLTGPGVEEPVGPDRSVVDRTAPLPSARPQPGPAGLDDLAYVIYTSGSTGEPKGVAVTHGTAANTIADVTGFHGIGPDDRALGLASLDFDLSVYDVFGILGAGGRLVLPDGARGADPSHWADLMAAEGVTVWNSVPAQMQMVATYLDDTRGQAAAPPLRLAMLSGDWIPVSLPARIRAHLPELSIVSMGGATEAGIWSIRHVVETDAPDPDWPSVPYGTPMANQGFRVLDDTAHDAPVWTVGELHITGAGLASGYLGDPELTAARFRTDPADGTRLYRTGDLGRYRPGGLIEFLGREDTQVKIRGHRIELGEIETALLEHPMIADAAVVATGERTERRLLGFAVPTSRQADHAAPGAAEIDAYLTERLPRHMVPTVVEIVDALPLTANGKVDRRTLASWEPVDSTAPDAHEGPADELEAAVAEIAARILAVPSVGRTESFAALGADSLVLAQMAGRLRDGIPEAGALPFDAVLRELLNEPTVAAVTATIRAAATDPGADEAAAGAPAATGNARLVPMGGAGGPLRVLIHAGPGTVDCYRPLAARLAAQDLGSVLGIAVADPDAYCRIPPPEVVTRCADDYAARLLDTGHRTFQMVGYCVGGIISAEVAVRLLDAGAQVVDFTLVDSIPVLLRTDEDLVIEASFMPDLGLDPMTAFGDVDGGDLMRAFEQVMRANDGAFPAGGFDTVGGDPGLDAVRATVGRQAARPQTERLADYARSMAGQDVAPYDPEMVPSFYRMHRQSFLAAQHEPLPYPGDISYLRAESEASLQPNVAGDTMAYWQRVCLGELQVTEITGDHLACVEEPHVAAVAEHLGARLAR